MRWVVKLFILTISEFVRLLLVRASQRTTQITTKISTVTMPQKVRIIHWISNMRNSDENSNVKWQCNMQWKRKLKMTVHWFSVLCLYRRIFRFGEFNFTFAIPVSKYTKSRKWRTIRWIAVKIDRFPIVWPTIWQEPKIWSHFIITKTQMNNLPWKKSDETNWFGCRNVWKWRIYDPFSKHWWKYVFKEWRSQQWKEIACALNLNWTIFRHFSLQNLAMTSCRF